MESTRNKEKIITRKHSYEGSPVSVCDEKVRNQLSKRARASQAKKMQYTSKLATFLPNCTSIEVYYYSIFF